MNSRTKVKFTTEMEIWEVVGKWASEKGYTLKSSEESERLYQKGIGFLMAPILINIKNNNQEIIFEAWVSVEFIPRLLSLFIIPSEMGINKKGFRLYLPREIARKDINQLLKRLNQNAIEI